jgi:predicted TIM-barrel fold metal-dependent hydrolase
VWIIGQTETTTGGPFTAAQIILSGLFDRLPDLRFLIAECGAGWLPYMMGEMDHMYYRHRHWAGFELVNPPSWYCTSGNLVWNLIADHTAIKLRDDIGIANLTWASDFPHSNCQYPYAEVRAKELTAPLTDQERYDVLWGNAARFYRLAA